MNLDEVIGEVVQRERRRVILQRPTEAVGEPRVAAHVGADGPVLPLCKAGTDVLRVQAAKSENDPYALALRRAVTDLAFTVRPKDFDQHGIVNAATD